MDWFLLEIFLFDRFKKTINVYICYTNTLVARNYEQSKDHRIFFIETQKLAKFMAIN